MRMARRSGVFPTASLQARFLSAGFARSTAGIGGLYLSSTPPAFSVLRRFNEDYHEQKSQDGVTFQGRRRDDGVLASGFWVLEHFVSPSSFVSARYFRLCSRCVHVVHESPFCFARLDRWPAGWMDESLGEYRLALLVAFPLFFFLFEDEGHFRALGLR